MFEQARIFKNRREAGKLLADILRKYTLENPVVLAIPRGGVPVGFEVAWVLGVPLDVIVVRKIGLPGRSELGVGAIAEGGITVFDSESLHGLGLVEADLQFVIDKEKTELKRRIQLYRGDRKLPDIKGRAVVLVDDGLATGVTAQAAIAAVRKLDPQKIIYAAPICTNEIAQTLSSEIEVACLILPINLGAIGIWYQNFAQTSDEEVIKLLKKSQDFGKDKKYQESENEGYLYR